MVEKKKRTGSTKKVKAKEKAIEIVETTKKIEVKPNNLDEVIALICTYFDVPFGKTHDWLVSHKEFEVNPEFEGRQIEELLFEYYPKYPFVKAGLDKSEYGIEVFAYPMQINMSFTIELGSIVHLFTDYILVQHTEENGCKLVTKYYKIL